MIKPPIKSLVVNTQAYIYAGMQATFSRLQSQKGIVLIGVYYTAITAQWSNISGHGRAWQGMAEDVGGMLSFSSIVIYCREQLKQ